VITGVITDTREYGSRINGPRVGNPCYCRRPAIVENDYDVINNSAAYADVDQWPVFTGHQK